MPRLLQIVERVRFAAVALAVSVIPEGAKRRGRPAAYASVAAHAVSGWVEMAAAAAVFVIGMLEYGDRFNSSVGWKYVSSRPTLTYGDFFGVGAIGYLSFLLTPLAWVTVWCFGEGIVRGLDAAISSRMLGMALVALPWRAGAAHGRLRARRGTLAMLGPERPDEVVPGAPGSRSALVVWASREKPWSETQVVAFRGEFYALVDRRLVPHGDRHAYRYDFRPLEPGELIRGALVHVGPEEPSGGRPGTAGGAR